MWVQVVRYDLFSVVFFLLDFILLILSLPLLGLSSKPTSLSPGFCVLRSRQYDLICWEFDLFSRFLFLLGWLFGRMESMDVAGVLQEARDADWRDATDPKCKLNISSFLTLPHSSDCLICSKKVMIMCCYCKWWGDGKVGGGSFMLRFGEDRRWVSYFYIFCFVFVLLLIVLSWLVHDSCCVFLCFFFAFFFSGPFD